MSVPFLIFLVMRVNVETILLGDGQKPLLKPRQMQASMQATATDDDDSEAGDAGYERQDDFMVSQQEDEAGPSGLSGLEKRQGIAMTWYTLSQVSHWYP